MKILVVHNRYRSSAPSGENRVVDQETAALREAGHEVMLFQRFSDDVEAWSPLRRATLPATVVWNSKSRRDLQTVLERDRPDVVHVHNTFPLVSPTVLYTCRDAGVPVVATVHNYKLMCASGDFFRDGEVCHDCADGRQLPALKHGCYRGSTLATVPVALSTRVHRGAWRTLVSAYICISSSLRSLLAGLDLDPERIFVKPNLVPHEPPSQENSTDGGLPPKERQVAYVGRLDAAKGVPLLMRAWDQYEDAGPAGLCLVIAGDGPLGPEVREWADARPTVEFVGQKSKKACADLVARSRAVVLPSQWEETFGLVAVEAMAAGVPPIAARHGSFPELITDGVDGVLFAAGDPGALANKIRDVDQNVDRYAELGRGARMTYEHRFRPDRNVEQLVDIYRFAMAAQVRA